MERAKVKDTTIIAQQGDVVNLLVEAVVSPDSTDFFMSRGAARAIAKASSVRVRQEIQIDKPINIGDVIVTSGGKLPAKHIMHVAVMEMDALELDRVSVSKAITNFLKRADENRFESVGIPVITSNLALFPYEVCAKLMINGIFGYFVHRESRIKLVTIAVFENEAWEPFRKVFKSVREIYQF